MLATKSLKRELGARGRHHRVPVWYHGELVGWTRYELLARHVDVNCTGEAEDPQALLLRTNTTITKTIMYYYSGTQNKPQCLQTALPYITKI